MITNRKSLDETNSGIRIKPGVLWCFLLMFLMSVCSTVSFADDTDIYKPKVKHNVMILMDSSGSMAWPLYDNTIEYATFFNYICDNSGDWTDSKDSSGLHGTSATYYPSAKKAARTKIYLIYGNTGYANTLTGDSGDPDRAWYIDGSADMHTYLNADGEFEDEEGDKPGDAAYGGRISTVVDATTGKTMITVDGQRLPNGKDVELHNWYQNYDGSRIDKGLSGMLQAPGNYFSGYFYDGSGPEDTGAGDKDELVTNSASTYTSNPSAADTDWYGREKCYFFATGNWINMQMIFNLSVYVGSTWQDAWKTCKFTPGLTYETVPYNAVSKNYPAYAPIVDYDSNADSTVNYEVYNMLSSRIRVHFSDIRLSSKDRLLFYDENGDKDEDASWDKEYVAASTDKWSEWVDGTKIQLRFITSKKSSGSRWKIDKYQYESIGASGTYSFDIRIDVARSAIIDVLETTRGKINWGLMAFDKSGGADGGQLPPNQPINGSFNDDAVKNSIIEQLSHIDAIGGTPLGEALQDVLIHFNHHIPLIHRDCNKNFVITLTDGFPSADTEWERISGLNFHTNTALHDSVQYTLDPMQYSSPANDYYDDIAGYLYTHSWLDFTEIVPSLSPYTADELEAARKSSADNITVHNIGFSMDQPMLQHASDLGGGLYLTAYSKSQLVNAFHSLGLMIGEYTAYTAPVVSVDEANRVQSGNKLYMAVFKPNEDVYWTGNLKKYGLLYGEATGCDNGEDWYVVDRNDMEATDCDGNMIEASSSYWSTTDGGDVEKGGVGQLVYESIPDISEFETSIITSSNVTHRYITTNIGSALVTVGNDTLSYAALGLAPADDIGRAKIVNFLYGYTYNASDGTDGKTLGAPVEKSSWPMGPIIHSTPKIIDYFDGGTLKKRLIAVGANDGMLHVFDDTEGTGNGQEVFAFVPSSVLVYMNQFDPDLPVPNTKVYTVDGSPIVVNLADNTKLLVFGLRRGGRSYYAINITDDDPTKWSFAWEISNSTTGMEELGYTMGIPKHLRIVKASSVEDILMIPGGYDTNEDRNPDEEDDYYLTDSHEDTMGRGIFLVKASDGSLLDGSYFSIGRQFVRDDISNPSDITQYMKYCFAADPTIVSDSKGYVLAIYMADLYGQVWKFSPEYDEDTKIFKYFNLNLIFKTNPMSVQKSAYEYRDAFKEWVSGDDPRALGLISFPIVSPRKTFYSPDVSYAGNCYTDLPVLYMGTGDREHPTYVGSHLNPSKDYRVKNGVYAFYDAHADFKLKNPTGTYADGSDYFTEANLLNVTCGALEPDLELFADTMENLQTKANIETFLREKTNGWYILFSDLDGCADVDNDVDFTTKTEFDGTKCISPVTLFAKVLYVPTFQPMESTGDPCVYTNVARLMALKYCTGNAAYNFYTGNDDKTDPDNVKAKYTRLDRYLKIGNHIPSGVSIVIRFGKAAGFISVGGKIYPLPEVDMPGSMIPFYWKEYNN
ncbi:MAG: PilC/PilY family type IV pilus protein [Pseudomonadota bacterium]